MMNCRVYVEGIRSAEIVQPMTFSIAIPGDPCSHWTSQQHIVVEEDEFRCKCGKQFLLLEIQK